MDDTHDVDGYPLSRKQRAALAKQRREEWSDGGSDRESPGGKKGGKGEGGKTTPPAERKPKAETPCTFLAKGTCNRDPCAHKH